MQNKTIQLGALQSEESSFDPILSHSGLEILGKFLPYSEPQLLYL